MKEFYCELQRKQVQLKDCDRLRSLCSERDIDPCSRCVETGAWIQFHQQNSVPSVQTESKKVLYHNKLGRKCSKCGKSINDQSRTGLCLVCYRNSKPNSGRRRTVKSAPVTVEKPQADLSAILKAIEALTLSERVRPILERTAQELEEVMR